MRGALGEHDVSPSSELAKASSVWEVRRDPTGTHGGRALAAVPWSAVYNDGVLAGDELRRIIRAGSGARMILVCSSPTGPTPPMPSAGCAPPTAAPAFECPTCSMTCSARPSPTLR